VAGAHREDEYVAKAVIVTAGADYSKLGVPARSA
jgi:hypothetical protein